MVCPHCGQAVNGQGRFCMHCGGALGAPASNSPPPSGGGAPSFGAEAARQKRSMRWIAALAIVGSLAAAYIGLRASGALRIGASTPEAPTLEAQGSVQAPAILRTEGTTPPPALNKPGERIVMPPEIRDWLEHLRRTEEKRMRLAEDQMAELMVSLTLLQGGDPLTNLGDLLDPDAPTYPEQDPPSVKRTTEDAQKHSRAWAELTQFFNSVPPPAECVPIRNEYDQVVRETGLMMTDIMGLVQGSTANPQTALASLMRMRGRSKERIDQPAIETDSLVQEICNKYNTRKWFDVKGDVGGGMLGKSGIF
ncbi:MAG: PepSY-associated TM helix domain-containing protein [Fimbriimonadaceae bacterium]|nr:hypothetical protein [Chthonomonadaceae bacterium]MCO5296765.1 PepSY-associated TM helix domain-containing protein [Fimbriimonadaceae bacterium]